MLQAVSEGLTNLLGLFKLLISRIFQTSNITTFDKSLYSLKFIFGFIIAFSLVFLTIRVIKKVVWGK